MANVGARLGMFFALGIVRVLPYCFFRLTLNFLAGFWFFGAKRLRKIARESLLIAFGSAKSEKEIEQIIRQCFSNISSSMTDLLYCCEHPGQTKNLVSFEGLGYLEAALSKGKGAVLVTAHFGNFPLMLLALAQNGFRNSVIIRKARDAQTADKIFETMSKVGVNAIYSIPARDSVKQSLQVLRDNGILCVLLDQNFGSGSGVFVEFFGQKAATATGPVIFAERTQAAIVPVFTVRENGKYRIIFEPELPLEEREDHAEKLFVNVDRITRIIERYIRHYPAEWGWMHRRWKSKEA